MAWRVAPCATGDDDTAAWNIRPTLRPKGSRKTPNPPTAAPPNDGTYPIVQKKIRPFHVPKGFPVECEPPEHLPSHRLISENFRAMGKRDRTALALNFCGAD